MPNTLNTVNMVTGMISIADQNVVTSVHTETAPSDSEWLQYLDVLNTVVASRTDRKAPILGFNVTDGGAPNAKQRARLSAFLQSHTVRGVVVTDSKFVRGVVIALSWLNPNVKAFSPAHLGDALGHLALPRGDVRIFLQKVVGLGKAIEGVRTLEACKRFAAAA
jgi:hypothetical protein